MCVPLLTASRSSLLPETTAYCTRRFFSAAVMVEIASVRFANAPSVGTNTVYGPLPVTDAETPVEVYSAANLPEFARLAMRPLTVKLVRTSLADHGRSGL